MFDYQCEINVSNVKALFIMLNILNDTPWGILFYFKTFLFNRYKDNNLSEMVFISSYSVTMSDCQSIFDFVKYIFELLKPTKCFYQLQLDKHL